MTEKSYRGCVRNPHIRQVGDQFAWVAHHDHVRGLIIIQGVCNICFGDERPAEMTLLVHADFNGRDVRLSVTHSVDE